MASEDAVVTTDTQGGIAYRTIRNTGQPRFLHGPSARVNTHLCPRCDDMLQRIGYAKYRPWPLNKVLFPLGLPAYSQEYEDERETPTYVHAGSAHAFVDSATNHPRCHLCALLLVQLVASGSDPRTEKDTTACFMSLWHHLRPGSTMVLYDLRFGWLRWPSKERIAVELQLRPIDGQRIPQMPPGFAFPRYDAKSCCLAADRERATGKQLWLLVQRWLQVCLETHGRCRSMSEGPLSSSVRRHG
jgi:hypothetical protein